MKFAAISTALAAAASAGADAAAPAAHPGGIALDPKFRTHLKCPYADRWLAKGPAAAAKELGLDEHGRKLHSSNEDEPSERKLQSSFAELSIAGSCTFASPWSGPSCLQFSGAAWTADDMAARCAAESEGVWSAEGCDEPAGWCDKVIAEGKHEASALSLTGASACGDIEMACGAFMGGTFVAGAECGEGAVEGAKDDGNIFDGGAADAPSMSGPPPGVTGAASGGDEMAGKCLLAPGAIGAAHQAGFSQGYSNSCPGTPAQESPYMWPLRWVSDVESHSMAYGSDDVVYRHMGRTYYMLDKNWKRSDTTYSLGNLRAVGQGPCDGEGAERTEEFGCFRNQTDGSVTTMIHRGGDMYFIGWEEDAANPVQVGERDASRIAKCTKINLAVIGNIRPDWFLDKRGDDTDVQYLGDQHVYYADGQVPRLVKQWRKKDFASQYFVMSMMGNPPNKLANDPNAPEEDNLHWPLTLNVPGEGFGDDSLQVYRNHARLTDEDEGLFTIIEAYEALGGECVERGAQVGENGVEGAVGPPTLEEDEIIPSNLEVDELSWVSNEITFSPIWEIPTKEMTMVGDLVGGAVAGTKEMLEVSDRLTVESCYDEASKMMDVTVHFHGVEPTADGLLPWMAMGYRSTEQCAMNPPDGGVTPLILITQESEGAAPAAHKTMLPREAKALSQTAFSSMYTLMRPLDGEEEYTDVSVEAPMVSADAVVKVERSASPMDDTVSLHFKQVVEDNEPMNLMYAIGMSSQLGIHATRGCFQVKPTPCGVANAAESVNIVVDLDSGGQEVKESSGVGRVTAAVTFASSVVAACLVGLF
ncbi:hypothetical protein ACHAXT_008460 [Thalassiosira profunda]